MYLVGFDVNHVPKVIIYIPVQCMYVKYVKIVVSFCLP